ncbi:hypothetical protein L1049_004416 [Liquidambar formosana]|uniref:Pectinesterase catalytic domain-containing protein n=1 Tax=Liquidambar formosana TaxID=63359 RepID=A0AAP0X0S3_LIQFO
MLKKIPGINKSETGVFPEYGHVRNGFPTWLSCMDTRLLQTSTNQTKYNLVVAKDGSGNFTTINEAVAAAPNSSATRFVIYIKAGAYYVYVEVVSKQTMLMFVGDGIGKTLIKGSRSVVDGWTTFRSATVVPPIAAKPRSPRRAVAIIVAFGIVVQREGGWDGGLLLEDPITRSAP